MAEQPELSHDQVIAQRKRRVRRIQDAAKRLAEWENKLAALYVAAGEAMREAAEIRVMIEGALAGTNEEESNEGNGGEEEG